MKPALFAEVIGDPVEHSLSPAIHGFWIERLGLDAEYLRSTVVRDSFASFLAERRSDPRWRGCNVTMPLKLDAVALADRASDNALGAGAANILLREKEDLVAGNTDITGLLRILEGTDLPNPCRLCLIGTGGAARAMLTALRLRGGGEVVIMGRDRAAGAKLLSSFGLVGTVVPLAMTDFLVQADLIVNATPLGMTGQGEMHDRILAALGEVETRPLVFDFVTSPPRTQLLKAAEDNGLATLRGIDLLIEQAAESFALFFGQQPPRHLDGELRESLGQ